MYVLVAQLNMRLFPPETELTGDPRAILYGPDRAGLNETRTGNDEDDSPVEVRGLLAPAKERRSLEGLVLGGAVLVLVAAFSWMALNPLIHHFWPELGATKQGPSAFPITAHIQEDGVAFTNGSTSAGVARSHSGPTMST
jgi:hypothetical protein